MPIVVEMSFLALVMASDDPQPHHTASGRHPGNAMKRRGSSTPVVIWRFHGKRVSLSRLNPH